MSTQVGRDVITAHKFGPLEFRTRGLGLYFCSDKQKDKLRSMTVEQLREINTAAWAQRKSLERFLRGKENVTLYGWNDQADFNLNVAVAICKASWNALRIKEAA